MPPGTVAFNFAVMAATQMARAFTCSAGSVAEAEKAAEINRVIRIIFIWSLTLELSGAGGVRLERVVRRPDAYHGDFNQ